MIDWEKIQEVLRDWFCRASGLPTYWFGEDVENQHEPFAELQVGSSGGLGVDETRQTFDASQTGREVIRTQVGNRLFTLSSRVKTRNQTPAGAARNYLEKVRTTLRKEWSKELFRTARLAIVNAEDLVNLDAVFQDRQQSEALLDIRFATIATDTDKKDQGGYIAQTEISSNLKDAGGTPLPASLQLDEERIPE